MPAGVSTILFFAFAFMDVRIFQIYGDNMLFPGHFDGLEIRATLRNPPLLIEPITSITSP